MLKKTKSPKKTAGRPDATVSKTARSAARTDSSATAPSGADRKVTATEAAVRAIPFNADKAAEHGLGAPPEGTHVPIDPVVGASTLSEAQANAKTGAPPTPGTNPNNESLQRVRVDSSDQTLTTNQGVPIADNQNSLKAGRRGPALLEDFILREKITHFDHERIPERIVHARGSGAHGFFESYGSFERHTRASLFNAEGKITPVFVRFSTVAGERGSKDTARDVRGFAVKFYTDEGNWDLVGNNIPVFFIQDAMKFPDLVHAVKPEPHHGMPQAASAHDTFWDFVSLMPESTHMLVWLMSDRAIPRSYRMMQGFGVHTFRLIDAQGKATLCKFHWTPKSGTHALTWDEAVKISGADPDYHRRDLWEAIESGVFPEYELGVQLFSEDEAATFPFDVLDATKLVPEEMVPITPIGRMVLNRNPDNFFAETEQVAFCTAHIVPGIDFTNDPLLAGRIHSYVDTQLSRLGGPNFHEIPINAPLVPVHNNTRDGLHRQAIPRGQVAYEPNSLGGGCPFQAGKTGFISFPENVEEHKLRAKPELFAEHYAQARLFFDSQTDVEKAHIVAAFRFELSKVTVPAIRERMLASLRNASDAMAGRIADGLNMPLPEPMPMTLKRAPKYPLAASAGLSIFARPGDTGIASLKVALIVAPGMVTQTLVAVHDALAQAGAVPRYVGVRIGPAQGDDGVLVDADASMENEPSFLFDALVLPDGERAVDALARTGQTAEYIQNQYRHCKPILALGASSALLDGAGASAFLPDGEADPGIVVADGDVDAGIQRFLIALTQRRHFERETDPPTV